jgi:hypothetical protein
MIEKLRVNGWFWGFGEGLERNCFDPQSSPKF